MLKIKVNLDSVSYNKLLLDMEAFGIVKKDKSVNKNKFMNLLFKNYYLTYEEEQKKVTDKFKKVLNSYNINNNNILNDLNSELISGELSSYQTSSITFVLNSDNDFLFESLYPTLINISDSAYFRNLILSYLKHPQYIRETIIFKDLVDSINLAINENKMIKIQLNNATLDIKPFCITSSKEELYSYLLGLHNNHVMSINIAKIAKLVISKTLFKFSDQENELLKLNYEKGVQFPFDNICEARITLTDMGVKQFNKRYLHRPIPTKIEGNTYYFSCSFAQLYFYFIAFANSIVDVSPTPLAKKFLSSYKQAFINLKNSLNSKKEGN
ncbi:MAG: hypothetical protein SO253_00980 [Bacilli bacterium]|nr:hypothetical protein [Bacilli bacterium]